MKFWRPALAVALSGLCCGGSAPPGGADAAPTLAADAPPAAYDAPERAYDGPSSDGKGAGVPDLAPPLPTTDGAAPSGGPATAADAGPPPSFSARCPAGPFPAPVAAASELACTDFQFGAPYNEGPTWVAGQGAFFFSAFTQFTGKGGDIIKYAPGGGCELFLAGVGCNGLAVTPDGNIVAACHQSRSVVKFDLATRKATTIADSYQGKMLDTPNDLVVHSNGTIYFTNPPFELAGRPAGVGIPLFRIDPAGVLSPVAMGRSMNGIGLAPDERRLYVLQGGIWDLDPAGVPSNQRPNFAGGDGMAVDCAGNVYASGRIYSPEGRAIGSYPGGTNLAFGGADGKLLLVVGGGNRVRAVHMNVPGLP
jgi:gluconolactonase